MEEAFRDGLLDKPPKPVKESFAVKKDDVDLIVIFSPLAFDTKILMIVRTCFRCVSLRFQECMRREHFLRTGETLRKHYGH